MIDDNPYWYKDAVIYQLHVKAFYDSNGDGIGDFAGLSRKLDYLKDLGVTALWLLPFYPSPLRDDGYDIADYRQIHPQYGSMRDFRAFVRAAHERGLRVMTELVINHTSDQHRWFQRARHAKPGSFWRDFYVWSDTDEKYAGTRIIFTDTETSNWAWDPVAKAYYWHRFFSHQPDLNFDNPNVVKAATNVMRFWLEAGVDAMRLDAVPYLCEREGTVNENLPETHAVLRYLRSVVDAEFPGRVFLAEANQWPEDVSSYFGDGDECHMAFHFPLMPRMFMAVADEDRYPITDIMRQTPEIPENCQWAVFLRNHDELTLEMVTDRERDYLYKTYAIDPRAKLNVGIRRRLAPLLENDRRRIDLMYSLMFSMRGTPIIYYGDEIGMGDNIYLRDRDGVRTPMQWTPDRNGGFSRVDFQKLYLPAIIDPVFGFESVNVEAQSRSPSSLLNWMKRIIRVRQSHRTFGRGSITFLRPANRSILAYLREYEDEVILCVANLSQTAQAAELDLSQFQGAMPIELIGRSWFPPITDEPYVLTFPGYGFFWFHLQKQVAAPSWERTIKARLPEFVTLIVPRGWETLLNGPARVPLEREVLPAFLPTRSWFKGPKKLHSAVTLVESFLVGDQHEGNVVALVCVREEPPEHDELWTVPLAVKYERRDEAVGDVLREAMARVRRGAREGLLYDALADANFPVRLLEHIRSEREIPSPSGGVLRHWSTTAAASVDVPKGAAEEYLSLKVYRKIEYGTQPELEVLHFLTDVARFPYVPALYGAAEYQRPDGRHAAVLSLQAFVHDQGDAWKFSLTYLQHALQVQREGEEAHEAFAARARRLGTRTAELHRAFTLPGGGTAFDPEPVTREDLDLWLRRARERTERALAMLERDRDFVAEGLRPVAQRLIEQRDAILAHIETLAPQEIEAVKTRYHGDYRLGNVLVVGHEYSILGLGGGADRSIEERREKSLALRDVASMLRSVDDVMEVALAETVGLPADLAVLEPRALEWKRRAVQAFLEGYRETIDDSPCLPADGEHARRLLELFVIEQAFADLLHELSQRSTQLHAPLLSIARHFGFHQSTQDSERG